MTILEAFRGLTDSLENPSTPLSPMALVDSLNNGSMLFDPLAGPGNSTAGANVNEHSALGMPAVWRAVNLIAGASASLPLHAYRTTGDVRTPLTSGQAADLLASPHPDITPFEMWEQVFAHLLLWGNAYLLILRNELGQVAELWPLHPSRVRPGRASDGTKVYQLDGDYAKAVSDREIMHIPGFGYDGTMGLSPIRLARQGVGLALAAEEFGARLFANGSLATGILQTDQRLSPEDADRLKSRWEQKAKGLTNAHKAIVLDQGAKFQQLSIPPEDAQFLETRRFQVAEIARIYGVPPHLLMDTDRSTSWGTGIEQQGIGFVVYTLRPWLTRVEQRLSRLLQPSKVYARYSVEGLLRGDTAARYAAYAIGRQWGWLSVNDVRTLEDLAPVDGGDAYMQPLNMAAITTQAQPAQAPNDPPQQA